MPQCPSPSCDNDLDDVLRADRFAYCDSCQHVSFRCPHCRTLNRSLARHCRQCGQSVSIAALENQWRSSLRLTTERTHVGLGEWLDLSALGVAELRLLCAYQGYLFIGTQDLGLIVTNAISPETAVQLLPGEDVVGLSPATTVEGPRVLVTTREVVYQLDLLPELKARVLYRTYGGFVTPALSTAAGAIVFEREAEGVAARLLQLFVSAWVALRHGHGTRGQTYSALRGRLTRIDRQGGS